MISTLHYMLTLLLGLGPRTFRAKATEMGDQSVWTDTPADRERKRQVFENPTLSIVCIGYDRNVSPPYLLILATVYLRKTCM